MHILCQMQPVGSLWSVWSWWFPQLAILCSLHIPDSRLLLKASTDSIAPAHDTKRSPFCSTGIPSVDCYMHAVCNSNLAAFSKDGEHDNDSNFLLVDDSPQVRTVFLQWVIHHDVFLSPLVALHDCAQRMVEEQRRLGFVWVAITWLYHLLSVHRLMDKIHLGLYVQLALWIMLVCTYGSMSLCYAVCFSPFLLHMHALLHYLHVLWSREAGQLLLWNLTLSYSAITILQKSVPAYCRYILTSMYMPLIPSSLLCSPNRDISIVIPFVLAYIELREERNQFCCVKRVCGWQQHTSMATYFQSVLLMRLYDCGSEVRQTRMVWGWSFAVATEMKSHLLPCRDAASWYL